MPTSSDNNSKTISIRGLSKTYALTVNKLSSKHNKDKEEYVTALNNVNLDIYRGEVMGIIGPNGSGKSTLLKILSQITEPDSGYADIKGKVASILEVGTGFNPDLSGKKNIYLNARIHGMTRREIDAKYDSIVSMFGFPRFLDTPVKQYSSGMYMRLAFAIVIHIDADIYLFDEVMSVGDIKFQKTSIEHIKNLSSQGKTVGIVTHAPSQIVEFTDRMSLLNHGELIKTGTPEEVTLQYQKVVLKLYNESIFRLKTNPKQIKKKTKVFIKPNGAFDLLEVKLGTGNKTTDHLYTDLPVTLKVIFTTSIHKNLGIGFYIIDYNSNQTVLSSIDKERTFSGENKYELDFEIPPNFFNEIIGRLGIIVTSEKKVLLHYRDLLTFQIKPSQTQSRLKSASGFINPGFQTNLKILE